MIIDVREDPEGLVMLAAILQTIAGEKDSGSSRPPTGRGLSSPYVNCLISLKTFLTLLRFNVKFEWQLLRPNYFAPTRAALEGVLLLAISVG